MQQQVNGEAMIALAEQAVPAARAEFSAKLDFTPRSLKSVESLLQKIHAHLKSPANGWSDAQLSSFCLMYGAYVGEVIRRHAGGEWVPGDANAAELRITAGGAHVSTFPCEKVRKRIVDGPFDTLSLAQGRPFDSLSLAQGRPDDTLSLAQGRSDDNIVHYFESLTQGIIPAMGGADAPVAASREAGNAAPARTSNLQKTYSVQFPAGWKSYEKIAGLSAYPPDGQSLITLTGNGGWIPFERFVAVSIASYAAPRHVPPAPPREIDAQNAIGRCFEFTMQHAKGTGAAWAYCMQCPTYMINVSLMTQGAVSDEMRTVFDGIVRSIVMRE